MLGYTVTLQSSVQALLYSSSKSSIDFELSCLMTGQRHTALLEWLYAILSYPVVGNPIHAIPSLLGKTPEYLVMRDGIDS